jgi:hypothetical protein
MIKIMEKNYFAALDFRLVPALVAGLGGILIWCLAIIGPFTGTVAGIADGLALLSLMLPAGIFAQRLGWSFHGALLMPFIFPCCFMRCQPLW